MIYVYVEVYLNLVDKSSYNPTWYGTLGRTAFPWYFYNFLYRIRISNFDGKYKASRCNAAQCLNELNLELVFFSFFYVINYKQQNSIDFNLLLLISFWYGYTTSGTNKRHVIISSVQTDGGF